MSKKDFIALADKLRELNPLALSEIGQAQRAQWQYMVEGLADFCQSTNPRFKRDRWLDYIAGKCGPNGGSRKVA